MEKLFTINLTRGAYVVREADAEKTLDAVAAGTPHILVEADLLGDGLYFSSVRIVVAHVIAVVKNDENAKALGTGRRHLSLLES